MSHYATVEELKDALKITSSSHDAILEAWRDAAENAIDLFCNREDGFLANSAATARYYTGSGASSQRIDECVEITEVAVKDSPSSTTYTVWTAPTTNLAGDGDWIACSGNPARPNFNRLPYTLLVVDPNGTYSTFTSGYYSHKRGFRPMRETKRGVPTVKVTAKWGYGVSVPNTVKMAVIAQAGRWYKRGQSAWTDTLANQELGVLEYTQAIDPDIRMMIVNARLVKPAVGAAP